MKARILASLLPLLCTVPVALAHELWIEPSDFYPPVGAFVTARLFVGEDFQGDPVARKESHIRRFVLADASGETPLPGGEGRDPAGLVRVASPGLQLIGYESNATPLTLDQHKLTIYIENEGLEPFFTGDPKQQIDDYFSRYAKALILAGGAGAPAGGYDRRFGFALELIPEADPYRLPAGAGLPILLLKEGKPLAGALVTARRQGFTEPRTTARTDAAGRVRLVLPGPGLWLLNAVFIRPLPDGDNGEWESWWASLTFEVPAIPLHPREPAPRRGN